MKILRMVLLSLALPAYLSAIEDEAETDYKPPVETAVTGSKLPENIRAAFARYLPEQKPENCNWKYSEIEQPVDLNNKNKKIVTVKKIRYYRTDSDSTCPMKAGDSASPDMIFTMGDADSEPNVTTFLAETSKFLPQNLLRKARELTNAKKVQTITAIMGPNEKIMELRFEFLDGMRICNAWLDSSGNEVEKSSCVKGAYGGME